MPGKPEIIRPKPVPKTSLDKLKETISTLIKQGKIKEEIIQTLVKENWPEDFVRKYIKKYFLPVTEERMEDFLKTNR